MFVGQKAHTIEKAQFCVRVVNQTFLVHALADFFMHCAVFVRWFIETDDDGDKTSQPFALTVFCTSCGSFYIRIDPDVSL